MSSALPAPIERYVAAENSGDLDSLVSIFTADATVRDEGGTHSGLDAIRRWATGTRERYGHTMTALGIHERGGKTVVDIRMTGPFPGSPVTLEFVFALADDRIASLEIGS